MSEIDLDAEYGEFWNDILIDSEASGDSQNEAFFRQYGSLAAENGDCMDLDYRPVRKEGRGGYQIDGYAIDLERGELQVAICDLNFERELQVLNSDGLQSLITRCVRFCEVSRDVSFLTSVDEASAAFTVGYHIRENLPKIRRVRCIVFTNARLAIRKKTIEATSVMGIDAAINVFDFSRYAEIKNSQTGFEPIEIDLEELNDGPVACLQAHLPDQGYRSFLVVMPGELLARLYGLYGTRLMEQNVRTFLQTKTKVNKGILETIRNAPQMFFAYNNGITATATDIELSPDGTAIRSIRDLQIVNGGQTTASLLTAKDKHKADLSSIFVQMKLAVVDPEIVADVVPNISRFANTQNKVSEADFSSSHPFHAEMGRLSRQITPPVAPGALTPKSWFYERTRGQYANAALALSGAAQRKFEAEYPKQNVIKKTDLSKYMLTYFARPHTVSLGEQKCFVAFADDIKEKWESRPDQFNEWYFKRAVAMTILFRFLDGMIGKSDWYTQDRGYKANYVTYTIAWLTNYLRTRHQSELDLDLIWRDQGVPRDLQGALRTIAPVVAEVVRDAPVTKKNVSEYAKDPTCWSVVAGTKIEFNEDEILRICVSLASVKTGEDDAIKKLKFENGIDFEMALASLIPKVPQILAFARTNKILSPKSQNALNKLGAGVVMMSSTDKNALKTLFQSVERLGGKSLLEV